MLWTEKILTGTWRSYKLFCFSGKIEHFSPTSYIEFSLSEDKILTMFHHPDKRQGVTLQPTEWSIKELKKRRYLCFGNRQAYEIITVESGTVVLEEQMNGNKIFFARQQQWLQMLKPSIAPAHKSNASVTIPS